MDKEVKELLEWVAEKIGKFDCSFVGNKECDDCEQDEDNYFRCVAKQILSHPKLALIDTSKIGKRGELKVALTKTTNS